MSVEGAATRGYGALLKLYPRRFRDEYGTDMVLMFQQQCRDESAWRVFARTAIDLAITIPTQHMEVRMRRSSNVLVPFLFTSLAGAGLVLAAVGGTRPVSLAVGLVVVIGAGALAWVAWRRSAPVRLGDWTAAWWKLLLAGALVLAAVIVAAGAGVQAWYLGMVSVVVALALVASGVVLGVVQVLGHVIHRHPA